MMPYPGSIRLAALASQKELIDLERWLSNKLNVDRDNFFEVKFKLVVVCDKVS